MKSICTLVVTNIVEFNRRGMPDSCSDTWQEAWHRAGADLSDMALFWHGDDKIVITPYPLNPEYVTDVQQSLGYLNVQTRSPTRASGSICEDILADSDLFAFLVNELKRADSPQMIAWGATTQFYTLAERLRQAGVCLRTPEVPEWARYWTTLYLDSKSGARQFCQELREKSRELLLPDGFILSNKDAAVEAIHHFYHKGRGFVLKANCGTGGTSVLCYDEMQLGRGLEWLRKDIRRRMSVDHFWDAAPVTLEEYIPGPGGIFPVAPTANFLILPNGEISPMGTGLMLLRNHHLYAGIRCGLGALDPATEQHLLRVGTTIGVAMADLGYRGWFDVDFVLDQDRRVYITEINARRASPCHVFEIGERLLGRDWSRKCGLYANDHLPLQGACHPNYATIQEVFAEFNRLQEGSVVRALPTIVNSSLSRKAPYLGYAVMADNAPRAAELALKLEAWVRKSIGMVE